MCVRVTTRLCITFILWMFINCQGKSEIYLREIVWITKSTVVASISYVVKKHVILIIMITIAETTAIKDLLRIIFGCFSHNWFFRSEVLGTEKSKKRNGETSGEFAIGFCRERHDREKEQEPPPAFSYYTHAITVAFRDTYVSSNRAVRRFAQSSENRNSSTCLRVRSVWNVFASRGTEQRCRLTLNAINNHSLSLSYRIGERVAQGWSIDHLSIR